MASALLLVLPETLTAQSGPQTTASFSVSGRVRYLCSGAPVEGVDVTLGGPAPSSVQTGPAGRYAFDRLAAGSWTARAGQLGGPSGAISALDAAWVLQASAGIRQLSPAQFLACDVTGNGSLSSLDAARILQRVVGLIPTLPIAEACGSDLLAVPALDWPGAVPPAIQGGACQPASFTFTPIASSVSDADFEVAYFGDCTLNGGSAAAVFAAARSLRRVSVSLGVSRRSRRHLRVPVHVTGVETFSALDLTLRYDPRSLRLVRVRRARGTGRSIAISRRVDPGVVRTVFAASTPLDADRGPAVIATFRQVRRGAGVAVGAAHVDDQPARVVSHASQPTTR